MQHCSDAVRCVPGGSIWPLETHAKFPDAEGHLRSTQDTPVLSTNTRREPPAANVLFGFEDSDSMQVSSTARATVEDDLDAQARAVELEAGFALDSLGEKRNELKKRHHRLLWEQQVLVTEHRCKSPNPNSLPSAGAAEYTAG